MAATKDAEGYVGPGAVRSAHEVRMWREVTTPEGAVIHLRIADASERAAALLIDAAIMMFTLLIGGLIILLAMSASDGAWRDGGMIMFNLFFFILRGFYFTIFEMGRHAATPGKRVMKLRVVAREGRQLTANAIFSRNVMRELEVFLPFTYLVSGGGGDVFDSMSTLLVLIWLGVFVLMPLFNRDKLRGGDLVAGTWVIRNPKLELANDVSATNTIDAGDEFQFTEAQLSTYGEHELQVLEDVLRASSKEVQRAVAERIRQRIQWEAASGESDRAFLEAFYKALRKTLETRMLFGKRKKDKFDTGSAP